MLDNDLRVRRFTPCAGKLFNLIPTDIGRPFSDINPRISVPDLVPFIRDVLDTLGTKEVEVEDGAGRWYKLRARPYKTLDNMIDGVVLALVDIELLFVGTGFEGLVAEHDSRRLLLSGRSLDAKSSEEALILLSINDLGG